MLIQAFERRVLTYTPDNPAAFRVEMGNVGQHYYTWRYGTAGATAPPGATVAATPPAASIPGDIDNCADFVSQAAVPAYLQQHPSVPSHLDVDNDGIACESNKASYDQTPATRT